MSKQKTAAPPPDFEDALQQLEAIVRQLEDGDLKLDDALGAFEQGIRLSRHCQQALQSAEQRVQKLIAENGQLQEAPFTPEDDIG